MVQSRMRVRRVVVTGMGIVGPVGLDVPTAWSNVASGHSGIGPITLFDASGEDWPVKIAGEARGFDPGRFMSAKEVRRADRNVQMALAASAEAVAQARLQSSSVTTDDVGVVIGSGAGGITTYTAQQAVMNRKGPQRMNPLLIPMITVDAAGIAVATRYGLHGPCVGVSSACATGADAIGVAFETIRRGDAEVMLTGGAEAAVTPLGIAGFGNLGVLSERNGSPTEASRPFDADRDGFVLSEGAGILVLESLESAVRRDVEPLAELVACASTMDAVHLTAPDQSSTQVARAIRLALGRAQITPEQVDYVNAHAAGTPLGDPLEVQAYRIVFGEHRVPVSSTKSMTGHLLGAAGAVEAIFCVQTLREKCLPPTINYRTPDPACTLDCVPNVARFTAPEIVLSCAIGFGGHNTAVIFARYRGSRRTLSICSSSRGIAKSAARMNTTRRSASGGRKRP
jgi:3-oxoacyl-[acyl-carrier-protein] synthase II